VQDLGGGLKADFRLESDINPVSKQANTGVASALTTGSGSGATATNASNNSVASTWGNGEARVGINGGFGRVDLGAVNFNGITTTGTGMPFGTAIGSGYGAMYRVDVAGTAIRDENAVKYTSPAFSGLTATLYKSNKQTKAKDATSSTTGIITQQTTFSGTFGAYDKLGSQEVGLNYANGPLAASYSTLTQDSVGVGTGTTESKVNTLGANYAVNNAAKVFFLNQTVKTTTGTVATDTTSNAFSATYTMGNTVLMASTGSLKQDGGTNAGKKSTITGLGADYNLSKTTALYARYESIKDEAKMITAASTIDGTDTKRTRTALGLRVTF
jgi:predicted porin